MFDVGFWELVILFGLGLMVLGPERMPKVAAKVGRWAGQARRMARNLSNQIRDEIEPFESSMKSMDQAVRKDFSALRPDIGKSTDNVKAPAADPAQASMADNNPDADFNTAPAANADSDGSQSPPDKQA
jgi:sec-independent protein translocase protein TatB